MGRISAGVLALLVLTGCGDDDGSDDASVDAGRDAACADGTADCDGDGTCEASLDDPSSCGACGLVCSGTERCEARSCVPADAGTDVRFVDAGPPACGAYWPERPDIMDDIVDQELNFALRDLRVDQRGTWGDIGWSLDRRCTESPADIHLCTPPAAAVPPLDGTDGRDNAFGAAVLEELASIDGTFETTVQDRMLAGETLILHLEKWNGRDDDPSVEIWLAQTVGFNRFDMNPVPQWDGDDVWNVSSTNFVTLADRPVLADDRAYVAGRTLVARLPDRQPMYLPFFDGGTFELRMTEVNLVGTISADLRRIENVTLSGRFALIDLEPALEGAGICSGSDLRDRIDAALTEIMDVRSAPGTGSPGATCDAMSLALPMTGFRSGVGDIVDPGPPGPLPCAEPPL